MNKNILLIGLLIIILVLTGCKVNPDSVVNPSVIREPILPELMVGPRTCQDGKCWTPPYCSDIIGGIENRSDCVHRGVAVKATEKEIMGRE